MSRDTGCAVPARIADDREALLDEIRDTVHYGSAALVFGAGVSKPACMPMWQGMISRMLGYAIQYDQKRKHPNDPGVPNENLLRLSASLITGSLELLGDVNPLESAEYVAQFFAADQKKGDPLAEEIRQLAIREMVEKLLTDSLAPVELLEKTVRDADDELKKLQPALISVKAGRAPDSAAQKQIACCNTLFAAAWLMAVEHGIPKAMSYNYDPLIQEQLTEIFGLDSKSLVTHPGRWNQGGLTPRPETRELYHVHGFIPGGRHPDGASEQIYPSHSGPIILSEDSYYRMEREEAYNWSASVQSSFLNRYNCVFVGFSAEDFNFRRILRQIGSKKEDDKVHYLFLTVNDLAKSVRKSVERALPSGLSEREQISRLDADTELLLEQVLKSRERYWGRFGVKPLFVTIEEIPELLVGLVP